VIFGEQVVKTDQPVALGGEGSASNPFQLFLASIAACSGYYALEFCLSRGISTEGMRLTMEKDFDPKAKRLSRVALALTLPSGFPDKYKTAIRRAVEACTVKKCIQAPPEFELTVE
jgi:putative redox protein